MIRNSIFTFILLLFIGMYWYGRNIEYIDIPNHLVELEQEQRVVNEKFITAQILSQSLNRAYELFEHNMATEKSDKKNQAASMEFLNELTDILNKLDVIILELKPKTTDKEGRFIIVPYELTIKCTYENYGKFLAELERNTRIIKIDEFRMDNSLDRVSTVNVVDQLAYKVIKMEISTLTLNKAKG
jgi:Tfp pilus assembly protein PilO